MGLVAKQSIWNTILLYAGVVIGYLNVTLFFPRVLGAEGYGLTRVILSIVVISQQFSMLGTPSMLLRYFPRFKEKKGGGLFSYAMGLSLIGLLVMILLLIFFKDSIIEMKREQSELLEQFYFLVIPILVFMVGYLFFASMCRVNLKTVLPTLTYGVLFKVFTAILLGFTWYFDWTLSRFLYIWAALFASNSIILVVYLYFKGFLHFKWDKDIDRSFVKESMDFSLFNMMAGASNSIISNVDILMVGLLLTAESLPMAGVYAIMVYLGNAIIMPTKGLSTIASPLIAGYSERGEKEKMERMYKRTSLNQMIAVGFLMIAVYINLPVLLGIMDVSYEVGMPVFLLIGTARLIQSAVGVNGMIINFSEYYRYTTYFIMGLAAVAITTNYLLIPKMGLIGAALASLVSIGGFEFLKLLFVWRKFKLQPFHKKHFLAFIFGFVLLGVNWFIPAMENIWFDLILRSSVISLMTGIFILKVDVSPDLKALLERGFGVLGIKV